MRRLIGRVSRRLDLVLMLLFAVGIVVMALWDSTPAPTHFGTGVDAMDYEPTDTFVRTAYIDGNWIGSVGPGGSTVAGGVSLPLKWHPGLTANIKWERCNRFDRKNPIPDSEACYWTEKTVIVHPYSDAGATWLHILDKGEVLIVPSMLGPGHENYPGPDLPRKNFRRKQGISR